MAAAQDLTPTFPFPSKRAARQEAQDILMHGVSVALGYWTEQHADLAEQMTEAEQDEFRALLQQEADRLAKVFGFQKAWTA